MLVECPNNDAFLALFKSQNSTNRNMRLPVRNKRVKEGSHHVKPSKVNMAVLLPSIHLILYQKYFIQILVVRLLAVDGLLSFDLHGFHGGKNTHNASAQN
uniref:Uncharacterized protein n=1 Tax=Opuntia streptacantha TaxID=393608 RepID=A0A7C9EPY2_OPUST